MWLPVVQVMAVVAGIFLLLALLASFLRHEKRAGVSTASIETAFICHLSVLLRAARREQSPLAVVCLGVAAEELTAEVEKKVTDAIRAALRPHDVVRFFDQRVAIVLQAPKEFLPGILGRVQQAAGESLKASASGLPPRLGLALYPDDGDTANLLWTRACASSWTTAPEPAPSRTKESEVLTAQRLTVEGERLMAYARRQREPLSFVAMEVDYLSRYAERFGEGAIAAVRQGLAAFLQGALREQDLLGQLETGEFALLLPCASAEAAQIAGRLAAAVGTRSISYANAPLKISISSGVAGFPDHGDAFEQLQAAALSALHERRFVIPGQCRLYEGNLSRKKSTNASSASTF